jgi:hypothetical protein
VDLEAICRLTQQCCSSAECEFSTDLMGFTAPPGFDTNCMRAQSKLENAFFRHLRHTWDFEIRLDTSAWDALAVGSCGMTHGRCYSRRLPDDWLALLLVPEVGQDAVDGLADAPLNSLDTSVNIQRDEDFAIRVTSSLATEALSYEVQGIHAEALPAILAPVGPPAVPSFAITVCVRLLHRMHFKLLPIADNNVLSSMLKDQEPHTVKLLSSRPICPSRDARDSIVSELQASRTNAFVEGVFECLIHQLPISDQDCQTAIGQCAERSAVVCGMEVLSMWQSMRLPKDEAHGPLCPSPAWDGIFAQAEKRYAELVGLLFRKVAGDSTYLFMHTPIKCENATCCARRFQQSPVFVLFEWVFRYSIGDYEHEVVIPLSTLFPHESSFPLGAKLLTSQLRIRSKTTDSNESPERDDPAAELRWSLGSHGTWSHSDSTSTLSRASVVLSLLRDQIRALFADVVLAGLMHRGAPSTLQSTGLQMLSEHLLFVQTTKRLVQLPAPPQLDGSANTSDWWRDQLITELTKSPDLSTKRIRSTDRLCWYATEPKRLPGLKVVWKDDGSGVPQPKLVASRIGETEWYEASDPSLLAFSWAAEQPLPPAWVRVAPNAAGMSEQSEAERETDEGALGFWMILQLVGDAMHLELYAPTLSLGISVPNMDSILTVAMDGLGRSIERIKQKANLLSLYNGRQSVGDNAMVGVFRRNAPPPVVASTSGDALAEVAGKDDAKPEKLIAAKEASPPKDERRFEGDRGPAKLGAICGAADGCPAVHCIRLVLHQRLVGVDLLQALSLQLLSVPDSNLFVFKETAGDVLL